MFEISYGCGSSKLSDEQRFSTFVRTIASFDAAQWALAALLRRYKWQNVAFMISESSSAWQSLATALENLLIVQNFQVTVNAISFVSTADLEIVITKVFRSGAVVFFLFCTEVDLRQLLVAFSEWGLTEPGYAYIVANSVSTASYLSDTIDNAEKTIAVMHDLFVPYGRSQIFRPLLEIFAEVQLKIQRIER